MSISSTAATDAEGLPETQEVVETAEAPNASQEDAGTNLIAPTAVAAAPSESTGKGSQTKKRRAYRKEYPASFWYEMCEKFVNESAKYQENQVNFLKSPDSGVLDYQDRQAFGKRLKAYKDGKLPRDDSIKRNRKGKFLDVEQCLLAFIETREQFSDNGKMAISWPFLLEMAKRFAVALGHPPDEFRASPGWLANVLKRHKMKIDFEVSDSDALYYLESLKRFCKKRKLGSEAQNLSARLQHVVTTKIGGDDDEGARMEGGDGNEEVGYEISFLQRRVPPQNHNPPSMLPPQRDLYRPTPFGAVPPAHPAPTQNNDDRYPPNMVNFSFWATQQQNI